MSKESTKRKEGGQPGNTNAEKWTEQMVSDLANELIKWLQEDDNIFFQDFLYNVKDLHPNIVSDMTARFTSFSELIKKAKKIQEVKLINMGVQNKLQPAMTIFVLKNHHNYKDRQIIEHEGGVEIGDARERLIKKLTENRDPDKTPEL